MNKIETTLALLINNDEILLALKKRGHGEGKYNGVGGKIKENETPEADVIRENQEEIIVTPTRYEKVGFVEFDEFVKGEKLNLVFHLYVVNEWLGNPSESDEMKPFWFNVNNIPYDKMFDADKYWLPLVLSGKKIDAYFSFDENSDLINKEIKDLDGKLKYLK